MKKRLLAVLLAATGTFSVGAQTFPANLANRFQTVLDSLTSEPSLFTLSNADTIGITMAISVPGIGTWEGVSGPAKPGTPFTTSTTIGIASCSKLYTAVMMLKLQENGVLSLNDHIGKWIKVPLHDVDTSATIRQLLQHETGIFDFINDRIGDWVNDVFTYQIDFWSYARTVDSIGAPHFPTGKGYRYSNTGYTLCAWIIEEATGNSYGHNLHQYITTPLGLTLTFDAATDGTALDQVQEASGEVWGVWYPRLGSVAAASMARGIGSIVAAPKDVAAFYQAVFNGSFLMPASRAELLNFEAASSYALGIEHAYSGGLQTDQYGHTGSYVGFESEAGYDPLTGASIFIAANSGEADRFMYGRLIKQAFRSYFPMHANDAGISGILSPQGIVCSGSVAPIVILTNHGSAPLTSATIGYRIEGGATGSHSWNGNLTPGASTQIALSVIAASQGRRTLTAWTQNPNGNTEGYVFNDTMRTTFQVNLNPAYNGYFSENFEGTTTPVLIWNANNRTTAQWGVTRLTGSSGSHSLSKINVTGEFGDISYADMPLVHLAAGSSSELNFNYACAILSGSTDSLQVLISTDCGATWISLYHKGTLELSQIVEDDLYFPQTAAGWHAVNIPLSSYSGDVLVRFRYLNGHGNNLYIDDISIGSPTNVGSVVTPSIALYPNPARDEVTVTGLPAGTVIRLTSITGQTLLETKAGSGNTVLDLHTVSPGMYLIRSPYGTKKLMKQ